MPDHHHRDARARLLVQAGAASSGGEAHPHVVDAGGPATSGAPADLTGAAEADRREHWDKLARVNDVLSEGGFKMMFQPIFDLGSAPRIAGYEALCRFVGPPQRSPDRWFAEADEIGFGAALELAAARAAIGAVEQLPPETFLSVNISPNALSDARLEALLRAAPVHRLVLEITEQLQIDDYSSVSAALEPLRHAGLRIAIDDVGAGYASLRHVLKLRPDFLKFDSCLSRGVDADSMSEALVIALVAFSRETSSAIVAEGIETAAELAAVRRLGVGYAQGFYLGRPAPLESHH